MKRLLIFLIVMVGIGACDQPISKDYDNSDRSEWWKICVEGVTYIHFLSGSTTV